MSEISRPTSLVTQQENTKLAMWVFLGGEIVFFSSLILTFILFHLRNLAAYEEFRAHLNIPLIGLNTFILISSSYLVVRSLEAIGAGDQKGLRNNLLGVLVLGGLFLGGQAFEWSALFQEGVSLRSPFGTPFFTVTGIHGAHVFVGLIWVFFLILASARGAFSKSEHQGIEIFGLYWHFVDVVWIFLFTVFYLI